MASPLRPGTDYSVTWPSPVPPRPVHGEAVVEVDPTTGLILANTSGLGAALPSYQAGVGGTFSAPGGINAVSAFASLDCEIAIGCTTFFFGYATASAIAGITLWMPSAPDRVNTVRHTLYDAHYIENPPVLHATAQLEVTVDIGTVIQGESTWSAVVWVIAQAVVVGTAQANSKISTLVTEIPYEFFWPA